MIKNISYDFDTKNYYPKRPKNKNFNDSIKTTKPETNLNYSLNNLKANYMSMSFKGSEKTSGLISIEGLKNATEELNVQEYSKINISNVPSEERIKGIYHEELSDDLATILGSGKNAILIQEKGVMPEIFVQSFAQNLENCKYIGTGIIEPNTKVIYINDPILFANEEATKENIGTIKEKLLKDLKNGDLKNEVFKIPATEIPKPSLVKSLSDLSKENKNEHKIVFLQNFDKVIDEIANSKKYSSAQNYFETECPNLSIVGLMSKPEEVTTGNPITDKKIKKAQESGLEDIPKLELKGLSSGESKIFLNKNPEYIEIILNKYPKINFKMSSGAISELIDRAAQKTNSALPSSALDMLGFIASASANETGGKLDQKKGFVITSTHVKNFYARHFNVVNAVSQKDEEKRFAMVENINTKLSDVGGIGEIKEDIQDDIISFLKNPNKFIKERGTAPKGVLLEGPPGTGKTLLARAIAGETNTPFFATSGSEFVERVVGEGASRVRELFKTAREAANNSENKTAIIFIDEFDALAKTRSAGGSGGDLECEQTLNQLLTEMDGFNNKESKAKIIILAATNRKDMLDPAAIRLGRFDDTFTIANPRTITERLEILNIHAKKLKFASETEKIKILDEAAKITGHMSGAEIAGVIKKAQKLVAKRTENKVITHNDIVEGFLRVLAGPINKISEDVPFEDVVKTVRHEGTHATAIDFLKPLFNEKITFITLDNRGDFLGAVFHHKPPVNPNIKSVILSAAVSYAGGLGEPEFDTLGRTAGARQDIYNATNLFRRAITEWGQGIYTPPIGLAPVDNNQMSKAEESFYTNLQHYNDKNIDKDMVLLSKIAQNKIAKSIVDFHKDFLDEYVEKFKTNAGKGGNNLSGEEFSKLRQEWLIRTGKVEAEKHLLKKVEAMLDETINSNKGIFTKAAKKIARVIA